MIKVARATSRYVCQACGAAHAKWGGKCEACGAWNTLVEEAAPEAVPKGLGKGKGKRFEIGSLSGSAEPTPRLATGINELDRVFGGGLVAGSAVLVGGDPGIGRRRRNVE